MCATAAANKKAIYPLNTQTETETHCPQDIHTARKEGKKGKKLKIEKRRRGRSAPKKKRPKFKVGSRDRKE